MSPGDRRLRALTLPVLALALVGAVLAVQLAHGGGRYHPLSPADPCAARPAEGQVTDLDTLTEALVLQGLADAACTLGVSRELLVLQLAPAAGGTGNVSDAQVAALHDGLLAAVGQLGDAGALPPASVLVDQTVDASSLPGLLKAALRAIPDVAIDSALATGDVLSRTVDGLDLRAVLAGLGGTSGQPALQDQLRAAVVDAVRASLLQRVRDLL